MIKLFSPYIPEEAERAVVEAMRSGCVTQGPRVDRFEEAFSFLFEQPYAVALNSGTAALNTAYDLIGLKPGDEVISTPLTCAATNLPLVRRGVKIIWADVLENSLCIDPIDVRSKITERTKAVVQVHLGGIRADVGHQHIPVVSDACQALGIFTGDFTCCSFQAIKAITTGDGGMLVVNDPKLYREAKLLRWFGIDRERSIPADWTAYRQRMMTFDIELAGDKRHMNDIQAAMGFAGLQKFSEVIDHRKRLFMLYKDLLAGIDGIKVVDGRVNVYQLATVLVERRDDFARMLWDAGVETNLVQVRNDKYTIFGGRRAELPVLDSIEEKYLSVPIGMHVSEDNVRYICEKIRGGWNG
jgi:perosamine synthetase